MLYLFNLCSLLRSMCQDFPPYFIINPVVISRTQNIVWWLILCVNLTGPRGVQIFDWTLWVCLWECFGMRLRFKLADWVKPIALSYVGGPQSIEDLKRTKRPTVPSRTEFFLATCLQTRTAAFSSFAFELKRWLFMSVKPANLQTGTVSLAHQSLQLADSPCKILGLTNLHKWANSLQ